MDIEGIGTVRILILTSIIALLLLAGCSGKSTSDMEATPDSASVGDSITQEPESPSTTETIFVSPQDAITGAYNLIDDASAVVDAANERTEELEKMMEDF